MKILMPWMSIKTFDEISVKKIKEDGIKLILFDFDNTLANHKSTELAKGALDYLLSLYSEGILVYVLSNAKKKRITPVLKFHGLEGRGMSYKPLPFVINKILRSKGVKRSETMLIGDQIFTDILAGNLARIRTVYVDRLSDDEDRAIRFKRIFERRILKEGKQK